MVRLCPPAFAECCRTDDGTDKTIKLWKVFEKSLKVVSENNLSNSMAASNQLNSSDLRPQQSPLRSGITNNTPSSLPPSMTSPSALSNGVPKFRLPRMSYHDTIVAAVPRKIFANAHAYHINSISINSDGETYMSADDLRINLWNLGISDQSFSAFASTTVTAASYRRSHRHSRHQARQYGRADRGHHRRRIPSRLLQPLLLFKLKGYRQAGRHARLGAVR